MQNIPWKPPTSQRRSMRNSKNVLMRWLVEAEAALSQAETTRDSYKQQADDLEARLAAALTDKQHALDAAFKRQDCIASLEAMWPSVKCQSCPDAKVMREARK